MKNYLVTLHEEPGDKFTIVFHCMADNEDHAEEQARNAYPAGEIVNITKTDPAPIKAFLIDPAARTVAEINIDPARGLKDYYAAIGCDLVEVAALDTIPGHDLWIDEEGLLTDAPAGFIYAPGCGQELFAGRAIVTGGVDDEGDTTAATCTAFEITTAVFAVTDLLPGGVTVCAPLTIATADNQERASA